MEKCEKDLKVQMPTQAWITQFAIKDIDEALRINPNISLKEYIDVQKKKTNIWMENPDFHIDNLGSLFMMAYTFLVVPKESIERYKLTVTSQGIDSLLGRITIKYNSKKHGLSESENIIRHIRNSISHANFDIELVNESIIFIDKFNKDITFQGEIKITDFKSFLSEYFKEYYKTFHAKFVKQ